MSRPPKPTEMTLNLAPMVDVLMCLIIFFLLASKLVSSQYRIDLPWAAAAKEIDASNLGNRVEITVGWPPDSDKEAVYVVNDWDGKQIVERILKPDEVEVLVKTRAARAKAEGNTLRCVIRADQQVQYQHVEVVLRACGLAKVKDVVFSANEGLGPKEPA